MVSAAAQGCKKVRPGSQKNPQWKACVACIPSFHINFVNIIHLMKLLIWLIPNSDSVLIGVRVRVREILKVTLYIFFKLL